MLLADVAVADDAIEIADRVRRALLEPITNLTDEAPGIEVLERGRGSWLLVYPIFDP